MSSAFLSAAACAAARANSIARSDAGTWFLSTFHRLSVRRAAATTPASSHRADAGPAAQIAMWAPTPGRHRLALVDAVSLLVDLGVLNVVETRGDYTNDKDANALYDIDDRRLSHLISAPFPPSLATSLEQLMHESRYGSWVTPSSRGLTFGTLTDARTSQAWEGLGAAEHAHPPVIADAAAASDEQLRRRARDARAAPPIPFRWTKPDPGAAAF